MAWPKHLYSPPKGAGWGGPAKGASRSRIKPGDPDGIQPMSNDPAIKARNAKRASEMEDVLYGIATSETAQEGNRISAAVKLHAIYEGLPIARTITANVSDPSKLTDADLAAIAAGGGAAAAEAEPDGSIH